VRAVQSVSQTRFSLAASLRRGVRHSTIMPLAIR
jgi:hypothetical protein